jgi:hypothetical protein
MRNRHKVTVLSKGRNKASESEASPAEGISRSDDHHWRAFLALHALLLTTLQNPEERTRTQMTCPLTSESLEETLSWFTPRAGPEGDTGTRKNQGLCSVLATD